MSELEAIMDFSIDKNDWEKVKFGDVVFEPKESVKDPIAEGVEHVVGLEHIGSEDIHLRRSASTDESTTFTKKFSKYDVLFGRRRAYLKKAAQARFEGICSGDITVMRAGDLLLPELLPFIINNDNFFDFAITHSAGGLSPRVKFKDLSNFELFLPTKDVQEKISKLLWCGDTLVQSLTNLKAQLFLTKQALFKDAIYSSSHELGDFGYLKSKYPVVKLGSLLDAVQYGISESLDKVGDVPVLRMNNIQEGVLDTYNLKYYTARVAELDNFILNKGDVLFNRTNSFDLVGKTCLFDEDQQYTFASYLIRLVVNKDLLLPDFLNFYMNTVIGLAKIRKYRTPGVSQSNINAQSLRNLVIPLPKIDFQEELMEKVNKIQEREDILLENIANADLMQKALISKVF